MKKIFQKIYDVLCIVPRMVLNLFTRIYDLVIKLISIKGFILCMVFYLVMFNNADIWAFIVVAGWLVTVRASEKGKQNNLGKPKGFSKEALVNWALELKDQFISKSAKTPKPPSEE